MGRFVAVLVACIIFASACTSSEPTPAAVTNAVPTETEPTELPESAPVVTSRDLFDQNSLVTYELTLSPDALARLDADPTAEEYVEGSLFVDGEQVAPVGIRYKGSVGAFVGCVDIGTGDTFAPNGEKICTKLSMKVKINWDDSDRTYLEVKKLQFHSMNLDTTQLHERLGYWIFEEMGVPAPRSVHARLVVNGEFLGVFALTEQIDGRFAREHFADGTGNVFKEVWPLDAEGEVHDDIVYLQALKTNEEVPTITLMRQFAEDLEAANTDAELKGVIDQWMDIDETMALIAVDRAIRNDDGPFHWYCFEGEPCSNHNFYWYADPSTEQLHLIPWDLDNAFENIVFAGNPITPIAGEWGEIMANCEPFAHGSFRLLQRSAACDKLTAGWALFDEEYHNAVERLLSGPFAEGVAEAQIELWVEQISQSTVEADSAHSDAISERQWTGEVDDLLVAIEWSRDALRG